MRSAFLLGAERVIGIDIVPERLELVRACGAQTIHANGGMVSVPGVYAGFLDKVPFGLAMAKALTIKTGQTHAQRYLKPLLETIEEGEIDPSFVITHRMTLDEAPEGYKTFVEKEDGCIKIVLNPN